MVLGRMDECGRFRDDDNRSGRDGFPHSARIQLAGHRQCDSGRIDVLWCHAQQLDDGDPGRYRRPGDDGIRIRTLIVFILSIDNQRPTGMMARGCSDLPISTRSFSSSSMKAPIITDPRWQLSA